MAMKKCLNSLNRVSDENLVFETIKDPQAAIYQPTGNSNRSSIPVSVKKRVINLLFMKDRCREEIVMTRSEMESLVNFKLKEISLISNKAKEAPATQFGVGLKSLLLQKAANYKNELSHLKQLWGSCLECPIEEFNQVAYLSFNKLLVPAQEEMNEINEVCEIDDTETTDLLDNYDSDSEDNNVDCWYDL